MAPKVAIVLVNWNSCADTLECLESLTRLRYPDFAVVLCDNASSDGSIEAVGRWARSPSALVAPASPHFAGLLSRGARMHPIECVCLDRAAAAAADPVEGKPPPLTVIATGGNLGFAGGNNIGIRYALRCLGAEYLWLLNTDTVVAPSALDALVARAQRDSRLGMVGSSLVYYWAPERVQALGGARVVRDRLHIAHIGEGKAVADIPSDPRPVEREMAYVVGASMLVSRAFVAEVGLMNESYFLYYEELDWAMRAVGRFALGYAPDSIVYHKVGGASRRVASLAAERYMWRNRIKFAARYMPESIPRALRSMFVELCRALIKGRIAKVRAIAGALRDHRRLRDEGARMELGARLA